MLKAREFAPDKHKSMSSEGEAMSADQSVKRDERTIAVENASFRWTFTFLLFALLADVDVEKGTGPICAKHPSGGNL
jgi:hypothetical protein